MGYCVSGRNPDGHGLQVHQADCQGVVLFAGRGAISSLPHRENFMAKYILAVVLVVLLLVNACVVWAVDPPVNLVTTRGEPRNTFQPGNPSLATTDLLVFLNMYFGGGNVGPQIIQVQLFCPPDYVPTVTVQDGFVSSSSDTTYHSTTFYLPKSCFYDVGGSYTSVLYWFEFPMGAGGGDNLMSKEMWLAGIWSLCFLAGVLIGSRS